MQAKQVVRSLLIVVALSSFVVPPNLAFGQQAPEEARKVKNQVTPVYPELAKHMNVRGRVKLEVKVTPEGKVKNIHILGGHPLLSAAAQRAVEQWRFEPGPKETTQIVEVNFD